MVTGIAPTFAAELNWPTVALPPSAKTGWVTPETRFNGIPMRIRVFSLQWPTERVVDYFVRRWRIDPTHDLWGPEHRGEGTWLMRSGDNFHTSLVVKAIRSGTEGTITVTPSPASWHEGPNAFFDVPDGLRLLLGQSSSDGDSLVLTGRRSPSAEVERVVRALEQDGWELIHKRRARTEPGAQIRYLARSGEQVQIVVKRDGRHSLLLLNRIVTED